MTAADIITAIKDGITALCAVGVALVAWAGLNTWKHQLMGKAKCEVARKLLRSLYRVREAIAMVRNPFMSAAEIAEASTEWKEEPPSADAAVYAARWNKLVKELVEENARL